MKTHNRNWEIVLILSFLNLVILTACGGDDNSSPTSTVQNLSESERIQDTTIYRDYDDPCGDITSTPIELSRNGLIYGSMLKRYH